MKNELLGIYSNNTIQLAPLILILLLITGLIMIYVSFLNTLSKTLKVIQPINREMESGQVYLLFIPLFNYIWMFITVSNISISIEKELKSRGIQTGSRPTYGIGLAYAILSVSVIIFNYIFPVLEYVIVGLIASIICFIAYWSNVASYKNKIEAFVYQSNNYNQFSQMNNATQFANQSNQGYQGGYSGGHNNHGSGTSYNNSTQNFNNQFPNNNDKEYKSGDLYK